MESRHAIREVNLKPVFSAKGNERDLKVAPTTRLTLLVEGTYASESFDSKSAQASPRFLVALLALLLLPMMLIAAAPQWWTDLQVLDPSATTNDYAAINQGQLKNLAVKAYAHLHTNLPSSVWSTPEGGTLSALITGFQSNTTNAFNYNAVNLGQLKTVAKTFYDVLNSVGYNNSPVASPYPWSASATPANDYAMANIGQAKNLFSFDLSEFTVTPPPDYTIPPVAPGNLTATTGTDGSVTLNWSDNSNNETGFTIERSFDGGNTWTAISTTAANATSYTDSTIPAGKFAIYRTAAVNSTGSSASTPPVSQNGTDPAVTDTDGDGLNDAEEAEIGTNPNNPNTDGDGVSDGEDGWPLDSNLHPPRIPETRYAVIALEDLGFAAGSIATHLNDRGDILAARQYWEASSQSITALPEDIPPTDPEEPFDWITYDWTGLSNTGVVCGYKNMDWQNFSNEAVPLTWSKQGGEHPLSLSFTAQVPGADGESDSAIYVRAISRDGSRIVADLFINLRYSWDSYEQKVGGVMWINGEPEPMNPLDVAQNTWPDHWRDFSGVNNQGVAVGKFAPVPSEGLEAYPGAIYDGTAHTFDQWDNLLSINDATDTVAVGYYRKEWFNTSKAKYWKKINGTWTGQEMQCWNPTTHSLMTSIPMQATAVNDRCEIVLIDNPDSATPTGAFIQNGTLVDLADRVSGWGNILPKAINNQGALVASAQKLGASGNPHGVLLVPIEINHADGDDQDKPMKYLPQWKPNDGVGKGVPVYDSPTAVLHIASISSTMSATFLGTSYQLTRNSSNTLLYQDAASGLSVTLASTPVSDPNVQETQQVTVSLPSVGINNAVYSCDETSASSNAFENSAPGIVASLAGLNSSTADTMSLTLYRDASTVDFQLTETGPNTLIFTSGGLTVQLVNNSQAGGTLYLALTDTALSYSNTVVTAVFAGSGQYRNFAPPTPTNLGAQTVDDFASFYIRVPVSITPNGGDPKVTLTAQLDGEDQEIGEIKLVSDGNGKWRSEKKLVLSASDADVSQMASGESQDFQVLKWPAGAKMDWTKGGTVVKVKYGGGEVPTLAEAQGVVLQSLDFFTKVGQNLDPENRIRQPFLKMGYAMDQDYNAPAAKTKSDYVKNKQIWYSMSHGGTPDKTAYTPFQGLVFKDGSIRASDLTPLELNYRLVIVDGCCSAHTSTTSISDSRNKNTLLPTAQAFANAFGSNVAYVGWSWEEPPTVQQWTGEFVSYLSGKSKTVQQAFQQFRDNHREAGSKEMKLYGHGDNVIDLKNNPPPTPTSTST